MSVISGIEITFYRDFELLEIIELMLNDEWNLGGKQISYILSKTDLDENGWRNISTNQWDLVKNELRIADTDGQPGIRLFYKNTEGGIELVKDKSNELNIYLSMGRHTIYENVTDFSWYLKTILPVVKRHRDIEYLSCSDIF